jgi:hypothetical protein
MPTTESRLTMKRRTRLAHAAINPEQVAKKLQSKSSQLSGFDVIGDFIEYKAKELAMRWRVGANPLTSSWVEEQLANDGNQVDLDVVFSIVERIKKNLERQK